MGDIPISRQDLLKMSLDEINNYNVSEHKKQYVEHIYICSKCRRLVSIDESYSNQGANLQCIACVESAARENDMSVSKYAQANIWNNTLYSNH